MFEKGPPHLRMKRDMRLFLKEESINGPVKGFTADEWDKTFHL